jgi:hypothetical protein
MPAMADALSASDLALLAGFFRRNGYVRWQDARRQRREGYWAYKKGDEVRLVAESLRELALIRRLLRRAGFRPGRPFRKGRQYRQPLYGRPAVARFLALIESEVDPMS